MLQSSVQMLHKVVTNKNVNHEQGQSPCCWSSHTISPEIDSSTDSCSECFSDLLSLSPDESNQLEWDACSNDSLELYQEGKAADLHDQGQSPCCLPSHTISPEIDRSTDSCRESFSDLLSVSSDESNQLEWDACSNDSLELYQAGKAADLHDQFFGRPTADERNDTMEYQEGKADDLHDQFFERPTADERNDTMDYQLQHVLESIGSILMAQAHTLVVKQLPMCATAASFMSAVDSIGRWNYDYLHVPIHNNGLEIQGFACINFPSTEEAVQFCLAASGLRLDGSDEPLVVCIASRQGIYENLKPLGSTWRCRLKRAERAMAKGFPMGHGLPYIRRNGGMTAVMSKKESDYFMASIRRSCTPAM